MGRKGFFTQTWHVGSNVGRGLSVALLLLGVAACGPSAKEIRQARTAVYTCPYKQVFGTAVEVVKAKQPPLDIVDPGKGVVASQFRWHDANGLRKKRGAVVVESGDMGFLVVVSMEQRAGSWFIHAMPHVYTHVVGSHRGDELTHADSNWPGWADTKADAILVAIHQRLKGCAVQGPAPAQ